MSEHIKRYCQDHHGHLVEHGEGAWCLFAETPEPPFAGFSVDEIREYMRGMCCMEPGLKEDYSLNDAIDMLEDDQCGIAAVTERRKGYDYE